MRGLKTAVRIWKKEIRFKVITLGISPEHRSHYRKMRQGTIKSLRLAMVDDLLNRHKIGDIRIFKDDIESLWRLSETPVMAEIEGIYKKYL
jgi:hypothetical protein